MQKRILIVIAIIILFSSCVRIPKETVTLSQTLGNDLEVLHSAHRNIAGLLFNEIRGDINSFIDDTYAPYVIHFVLNSELQAHQAGKPSLYTSIELAGQNGGKQETEAAVTEMFDFQLAARKQIERKRNELLSPTLVKVSEQVNEAVTRGKAIDIHSANVLHELDAISNEIKEITRKK